MVDEPGWYSYILEKDGEIIAARTLYVKDKWGSMGIDAPVPGVMTQNYEPDYWLFRQLVADGLCRGVEHFIADIEKPDYSQEFTPYTHLKQLGFQVLYRRLNYMPA